MVHGRGSECAAADGLLDWGACQSRRGRCCAGRAGDRQDGIAAVFGGQGTHFPSGALCRCRIGMELAFAGLRELCDFQGRPLGRRSFSAGLPGRFTGEIRGG